MTLYPAIVSFYFKMIMISQLQIYIPQCATITHFKLHVIIPYFIFSQLQMTPIERWCFRDWGNWYLEELTFRQGLEETSKDALNARLCCVVRMVRGRLGLLGSFPSSPFPVPPEPFSFLISNSSSSLFSGIKIHHSQESVLPFKTLQLFRQPNDKSLFLFFSILGDSVTVHP